MTATTQLEMVNVNAEKRHGLDNQQPSIIKGSMMMTVQRLAERRRGKCLEKQGSVMKARPIGERLSAKVDTTGSDTFWNGTRCHVWTGWLMPNGYGQINKGGKAVLVHRVAWEVAGGEIPQGTFVLHRCDNRKCVNPQHLFLGSFQDNMDDMVAKRRHTHGIRNPHAKLSEQQVLDIRSAVGTHKVIAGVFGVSQPLVTMIRNRKIWRLLDKI